MEFKDLGLSEPVLESLHQQGFSAPTSIQEKSIPPLMQGRDAIAKAQTGSGKTLAFGIPLLEKVDANRVSIQAVVVCPTRELAQQVADDLTITGKNKGIKVALVVGGVHVRTQRMSIPGCQVVVGTPGRMVDLLEDRYLPVEWTEFFVLDEFDRLLDMGFLDDIKKIVSRLPDERQTALYSATTPQAVMRHAHGLLNNPVEVEIHTDVETVSTVDQRAVRTTSARKLGILERLLAEDAEHGEGSTIVFCNTKRQVRQLDRELWAKDFSVASLSGDHDQSVRFKVMERFRNEEISVLVATDVAARGLDIDHIGHVINYDVPFEVEDYVHRIGRTARAGREGVVTTLVGAEDHQSFSRILRELGDQIEILSGNLKSTKKRAPAQRKKASKDGEERGAEAAPEAAPSAPESRDDSFGANIEAFPEDAEPAAAPRDDSGEGDAPPAKKKRRRRRRKSADRDGDERPRGDREGGDRTRDDREDGDRSRGDRDGGGRSRGDRGEDRQRARGSDDEKREPRGRSDEKKREPRGRSDERRGGRDGQGDEKRDGRDKRRDGDGERKRRDGGRDGDGERKRGAGSSRRDSRGSSGRRDDDRRDGGGRQRSRRGGGKKTSDDEPSSMISGERDDVDHLDGGPPRRGGGDPRRARNRYKRWEEEQLNKPVGLITDNWDQVEEIDEIRDGKGGEKPKGGSKGSGSRSKGPSTEKNGNAGKDDNSNGASSTKSEDGSGRKRRRSRRSRGGRGRSGSARESSD